MKGFGEDVGGVVFRGHSPNPHKVVKIVLANGVVSEVYAARVFGHGGLGGDVFGSLVVGVEVVVGTVVAEKFHHCVYMFACLIASG